MQFDNLILRWSVGSQDTVSLTDAANEKIRQNIWLTKLSIASFQKWFPGAKCYLLYNGSSFSDFLINFNAIGLSVKNVEILNQLSDDPRFINRYPFLPRGVWWKWLPFRLDVNKTEIAIDTDIFCVDKPETWYDWISQDKQLLIAPERYKKVIINTCGDFWQHPVLKNKQPFNCGVVGQQPGVDFGDRFFEITQQVRLGETHNSMFITEQGAINVWARSLEMDGHRINVLDFNKNSWLRDFLYFWHRGVKVETLHAVMWHKKIIFNLREIFERKITDNDYSMPEFVADIMRSASKLDAASRALLGRQLGHN